MDRPSPTQRGTPQPENSSPGDFRLSLAVEGIQHGKTESLGTLSATLVVQIMSTRPHTTALPFPQRGDMMVAMSSSNWDPFKAMDAVSRERRHCFHKKPAPQLVPVYLESNKGPWFSDFLDFLGWLQFHYGQLKNDYGVGFKWASSGLRKGFDIIAEAAWRANPERLYLVLAVLADGCIRLGC